MMRSLWTVVRWLTILPVSVLAGILASLASDLTVALFMLITKVMPWPPPPPGPPWIYSVGGAAFGIVYLLVSYFLAPNAKSVVAILMGVLAVCFFCSLVIFAGPLNVTLYPPSVDWAAVGGVCVGLVVAGMLLIRYKHRSLRAGDTA